MSDEQAAERFASTCGYERDHTWFARRAAFLAGAAYGRAAQREAFDATREKQDWAKNRQRAEHAIKRAGTGDIPSLIDSVAAAIDCAIAEHIAIAIRTEAPR